MKSGRHTRRFTFGILLCGAALLRILAAVQPGPWADDIFSLAMATAHSLEHPAVDANPALGDFIEPQDAQPAAAFRRYLEHDAPPLGAERVIRAVSLSDTSPPLSDGLLNVLPEDMEALASSRCRVALVKAHDLGALSPAEVRRREHMALARRVPVALLAEAKGGSDPTHPNTR